MSGAEPPVPAHPKRAWWIPLLGVGSLGTGGLQALAGLAMIGVALSGPPAAMEGFLLPGLAWFLPGILLGASGLAVAGGWRSARLLCLLAVAVAAAGIGTFVVLRESVPPAMAEAGEWAMDHPEAPKWAKDLFDRLTDGQGRETLRLLRRRDGIEAAGVVYSAYCCCPVLPWYLLVLAAGLTRTLGGSRRSAGGA